MRRAAEVLAASAGIQVLFGQTGTANEAEQSPVADNSSSAGSAIDGSSAAARNFKLSSWTGDDFTLGHELRSRQLPQFPAKAEKTVDFVIIGGGMSGLTTAYHLRNHNYLLLEQYKDFGGQSRGSSFQGIGYSYGAAYVGELEGELEKLVDDLGLKPVQLDAANNSWRWENEWVNGISGEAKALYKEFNHLRQSATPVWDQLKRSTWLMPLRDDALSRLDQTSFASCLTAFDPKFIALLDALCKSCTCAGVEKVSALAGYSTVSDLLEPINVFPGGNQALASALAQRTGKEPGRCLSGTFVWSVAVKEQGASVVYGTSDGAIHRVDCRYVIVCTPPLVSARLLSGIDDATKAQMLGFKYGSYLVANLLMKTQLFNGAYDNWVSAPFTFADIVKAEKPYQINGEYKESMGSVLTVYQPYEPGSSGRPELLKGDREAFASSIVSQMQKLVGNLDPHLQEIVLTRWGHAMAVPNLGFFKKMTKLNATISGAYTLAHSSSQGIPCAESAVRAAKLAATKALNSKSKTLHFQFVGNPIASNN